ncbi:MAG: hypothetical protein MR761_06890 [Butyricicoccus porcorum]|nr:hypothetical protein [Butyricicoccus porcorum]
MTRNKTARVCAQISLNPANSGLFGQTVGELLSFGMEQALSGKKMTNYG